ncbi:MAG: hypothetical protein F4160_06735 [Rhodospirillaceae bacterium]|nr:hypothetical protein [Rhodospirillaceae bacterium]MYH36480.1 hypothetical protein [Rhodospirillaceae bacterium]MYK13317.1 hypothetical protein [Rhodospirillaceae bacterium]
MPGYKPSESTKLIEPFKIVNAPPRASLIFLLTLATLATGLAALGLVRHGAPVDRAYAGSIERIGRKPGPMLDEHALIGNGTNCKSVPFSGIFRQFYAISKLKLELA